MRLTRFAVAIIGLVFAAFAASTASAQERLELGLPAYYWGINPGETPVIPERAPAHLEGGIGADGIADEDIAATVIWALEGHKNSDVAVDPPALRADLWLDDPSYDAPYEDTVASARIWIWADEGHNLHVELLATAEPLRRELETAEDFQLLSLRDEWQALGGVATLGRSSEGFIRLSFSEPLSPHDFLRLGNATDFALTFTSADGPGRWELTGGEGGEYLAASLADYWLTRMLGAPDRVDGTPAWMAAGPDMPEVEGVATWRLERAVNGTLTLGIHVIFPDVWQFVVRFFAYSELQHLLSEETRSATSGALAIIFSEVRFYYDSFGPLTGATVRTVGLPEPTPLDIIPDAEEPLAVLGLANPFDTGMQVATSNRLSFAFDGPDGPITLVLAIDLRTNLFAQIVTDWLFWKSRVPACPNQRLSPSAKSNDTASTKRSAPSVVSVKEFTRMTSRDGSFSNATTSDSA